MEENKLRVLVIGTWGFPGGWSKVNYRFPKPPSRVEEWRKPSKWGDITPASVKVASHSTTMAIGCILKRIREFEVEMAVLGLDTVSVLGRFKGGDEVQERVKKNLEEKVGKKGCLGEESVRDGRDDVVSSAEVVVNEFISEFRKELGDCLNDVEVKTIILPGTGRFKYNISTSNDCTGSRYYFKGSPMNMLAVMRLELDKLLEEKKPDAVILDLSHGVNYLPVLARDAVMESIALYSALQSKKVGLALVNSDPDFVGNESLIHLVESTVIERDILGLLAVKAKKLRAEGSNLSFISTISLEENSTCFEDAMSDSNDNKDYENKYYDKHKNYKKKLKEIYDEYEDILKPASVVVDYGLIPYLVSKILVKYQSNANYNEINKDINKVENTIRDAIRKLSCNADKGEVIYLQPYIVQRETVDLVDALKLLRGLLRIIHSAFSGPKVKRVGDTILIDLDELKRIISDDKGGNIDDNKSYPRLKLSPMGELLLKDEIDNLESKVGEFLEVLNRGTYGANSSAGSITVFYDSIISWAEERKRDCDKGASHHPPELRYNPSKCVPPYKRNFLAHAGMERNTVVVHVENDKIYVGYTMQCLEEIDKNI